MYGRSTAAPQLARTYARKTGSWVPHPCDFQGCGFWFNTALTDPSTHGPVFLPGATDTRFLIRMS